MNEQVITLDLSKAPARRQVVRLGQSDVQGTTIVAEFYDGGTRFNIGSLSCYFCMRVPGGKSYVRQRVQSTSGNVASYTVDESVCCAVAGTTDDVYFELCQGSNTVYSTARFTVHVLRAVTNGSLPAEPYVTTLQRELDERPTRDEVNEGLLERPTRSEVEYTLEDYVTNSRLNTTLAPYATRRYVDDGLDTLVSVASPETVADLIGM